MNKKPLLVKKKIIGRRKVWSCCWKPWKM